MQLGVKDIAGMLAVSEKTIYRWIKQKKLPAYRVNDQYRFNRAEILEWATASRINVSPDLACEPQSADVPLPRLDEALEMGGIHYRVNGNTPSDVLGAVVQLMHLPDEVDKSFLLQVLIAREALGSTGIGDGIAIPHLRNPIVLHIQRPMISLCFLENPIDFRALDGKPVNVLFTLISPTVRAHLHLLSKLSFALRDPQFKSVIIQEGSRDEIMSASRRIEDSLLLPSQDHSP
ncbi:PTS sugar transporter subunit IIA [Desulfatirhabdium butyrativorans]|uniref:PTS sugar transporter subunit IIA n=1 Tax=Desulfatirhabdium butyrativorans TaxID=340467 RepID=UPI00041FC455|nr:PTS sugar transporter subunit IIA [Desulfatirhabdium butyrativorans]